MFAQDQPAIRAVMFSMHLEVQQCALELGVPGYRNVPREGHLKN